LEADVFFFAAVFLATGGPERKYSPPFALAPMLASAYGFFDAERRAKLPKNQYAMDASNPLLRQISSVLVFAASAWLCWYGFSMR
jgi:hypothetical protein